MGSVGIGSSAIDKVFDFSEPCHKWCAGYRRYSQQTLQHSFELGTDSSRVVTQFVRPESVGLSADSRRDIHRVN